MPSRSSPPANTPSSAVTKTGGDRLLAKMFASTRFIPSNSHGYFWDVEEIRHQEHLRRVSHAQHLYRRRHDSAEAARLYRSFMEEQNEWMDEQEQMKEMELRLSVKAYQQRASRWEDEWRRLEEGGNVEEILKPHRKTAAALLVTDSSHYGYLSFSGEETSTHGLSDLFISPPSISSLDLPSPLLSFPGSPRLACPEGITQQMDGAHHTKIHRENKALSTPRFPDSGTLNLKKISMKDAYTLVHSQEPGDECINSQPGSFESRDGPSKSLHHCSETTYDPKDTPVSQQSRIMSPKKPGYCAGSSKSHSSLRSPGSSSSNWSRVIPRSQLKQERNQKASLADGEVLRIIAHKSKDNGNLLYLISWRLQNSGIPPVQCWVRAADLVGGPRKSILEEYHLQHKLGPVRYPRNPRRQLRSSTSFGVREIKAALDERKQALLERGANLIDITRELDEERWRMRDDWQRAGRGWGSAIMVVEDRKKAWKIADLEAEDSFVRKAEVIPARSPEVDSSSHSAMLKAAGIIDAADSRTSLRPNELGSNSLRDIKVSLPKTPDGPLEPSSGSGSNSNGHDESEWKYNDKATRFMSTSEDEREWREHFGLEPECIEPTNLSTHSTRGTKISRVKSTLHSLPNTLDLNLVRAKTLPEIGKQAGRLQVLNYEYQEPTHETDSTDSIPVQSSESESQSYLKEQRKSLLSRILSRKYSKRENRNQDARHNLDVHTQRGSQGPPAFATANTEPLRVSKNCVQASQSDCYAPSASPSSYASFDGAQSERKVQIKKGWRETVWDKLSYLLASSGNNPPFPRGNTGKVLNNSRLPDEPLLTTDERKGRRTGRQGLQNNVERRSLDGMSLFSRPLLVETITRRTASWAASLLPPLHRSKSEEPGRMRSSFEEVEPSSTMTDTEESGTGQHPPQTQVEEDIVSNDAHRSESYKGTGKLKGKAKLEIFQSPRSVRSVTLVRTLSQEQYLAKKQAERQFQRDKALLRTKNRVRMRKEKAEQRANDLERLDELQSKKTSPFSRWKKSDQLELDLLTRRLDMGADKGPGKGKSKNMTVADIKNLRRSIASTTAGVKSQPKGRSPI